MKRLSKVKITWSARFAYAIGLIATDGNLSKDGRHINFTSKDEDLVLLFKQCLEISNKIGLTQAKSKTIGELKIPHKYFMDFFRGCVDGDGSIGVFHHPESCHPQLRIRLYSASENFLCWIQENLVKHAARVTGSITYSSRIFRLAYGKSDSEKILRLMYKDKNSPRLHRKYMQARPFLGTILELIKSLGFYSEFQSTMR